RRTLDAQFEVGLHQACERTDNSWSRSGCSVMATAASWAVRINTWRQHGEPPVREGTLAIATGSTGVLTVGAGTGLGLLGLARLRRRLARTRIGARLRAPRASTAFAVTVGAFVASFPGSLPHPPLLQGAVTGLCVLTAVGLTRLIRRPEPVLRGSRRSAALNSAWLALGLIVLWFTSTQNALRAQSGWEPLGVGYPLVVASTVAAMVVLFAGLGWLWRHRRRIWRPAAAALLTGWLVLHPLPGHAVGSA